LGELSESVLSGKPSFDKIFGESFFDWTSKRPEENERFASSMHAATVAAVPFVLQGWNFSAYRTIVDVGGGRGALLSGILAAYPHAHGVLYDLPAVVEGAHALKTPPLSARCTVSAGNFFDAVPQGGDLYLLRSILHDWNDDLALKILRNCRYAMRPGATLLILEGLNQRGSATELLDLHMMVLTGGRERSQREYADLLQRSGFKMGRVVMTGGPAIVESSAV